MGQFNLKTNNMKQTAVEWLFEKLWNTDKDKFTWYAILKQAKEIEKKQIVEAYDKNKMGRVDYGEQYYNERFKSEQQSVTDDTL